MSVILSTGALQPGEGSGEERYRVVVPHARSLAPLEKARGFGMTLG